MILLIAAIAVVAVGAGVGMMILVYRYASRGELKEDMTAHESRIMAGATLNEHRRSLFEKTFGRKKTIAATSSEVSLSWADVRQALKRGELIKLWPLFFIAAIAILVAIIFVTFR